MLIAFRTDLDAQPGACFHECATVAPYRRLRSDELEHLGLARAPCEFDLHGLTLMTSGVDDLSMLATTKDRSSARYE